MLMNIGKRIEERLKSLNWERRDLLDRVDGLTAQALSNLIRRDSKRSEWDEAIANALGIDVLWLVYGKAGNALRQMPEIYEITPKSKRQKLTEEISTALEKINEDGLIFALGSIEAVVQRYPRETKQTPSS